MAALRPGSRSDEDGAGTLSVLLSNMEVIKKLRLRNYDACFHLKLTAAARVFLSQETCLFLGLSHRFEWGLPPISAQVSQEVRQEEQLHLSLI